MFRQIRKKKNDIGTEAAKEILKTARRGVLAVNGDGGYPYAVPLNFFYDETAGKIFFHGARAGHKAEALERSGKVCFTVLGEETVKAEPWAPFVKSAVAFGTCRPVEDREETLRLVKRFAMKYYPSEALVDEEVAASGKAVRMYEIAIEHLTGKEVQEI